MKIYRTPLYPALMVRLPGPARRSVKASGGYFNVPDEDVESFEKFIAARPQYQIVESEGSVLPGTRTATTGPVNPYDPASADGAPQGVQTAPEPMSDSERNPEKVKVESLENLTVPTLRARLAGLGLPSDGGKTTLVKRLADATDTPTGLGDETTPTPVTAATSAEDFLSTLPDETPDES
jgi:hypothetical protein